MLDKIKKILIDKHGQPDSEKYLNIYLDFLLNYNKNLENSYTEKHHILSRSVFPEYLKEEWNIVELKYKDHIEAHLLLFKAFNLRVYQRPLNYMLPYYKDHKSISNASKRGWKNLKADKEKYNKWLEKRIAYLKSLDSKHYSDKAKEFWENISPEEYIQFCKKIKNYWTEDKRKKKSEAMLEYYKDENNILKKKKESQERWDNMSSDKRLKFNDTMKKVNSSILKRKKASIKLKQKWQDPSYLEKMKNRKYKKLTKYQVISENGDEKIIEGLNNLVNKYNFNKYLIRKFLNTDKKVETKSNKIEAFNTIGYKFNTI